MLLFKGRDSRDTRNLTPETTHAVLIVMIKRISGEVSKGLRSPHADNQKNGIWELLYGIERYITSRDSRSHMKEQMVVTNLC